MSDKEENEVKAKTTPEDLTVAFSGPAVYSNKVTCSVGAVVRISFLEETPDKKNHFRTAVAMHHQDAINLYKLLENLLENTEIEIAKLSKESQGDGNG